MSTCKAEHRPASSGVLSQETRYFRAEIGADGRLTSLPIDLNMTLHALGLLGQILWLTSKFSAYV